MTLTPTELGLLVAVIAVGGVIVGGLVAGGFALLTSWLDDRRTHARWLRDRRFDVYTDALAAAERLSHGASRREWIEVSAAIDVVGPRTMQMVGVLLSTDARKIREGGEVGRYTEMRLSFVREAQKVLGIPAGPVPKAFIQASRQAKKERRASGVSGTPERDPRG
jgi:hypothetical protein